MNGAVSPRELRIRLPMLLTGVVLFAGFFGLDSTSNTTRVKFFAPWDASSRGELYFWLGALLFLLPGTTLIGASVAELARATLVRIRVGLESLGPRQRLLLCLTLGLVAWSLARIGNQVVLLGQPFTDDEDAARFGGQVLSSGSLWAPIPPLRSAFPDMFLFQRGDRWTSFDFLGALLPWSVSELTGTGTLVFSFFAALLPLSIAIACTRRHGVTLGIVGAGIALCSPMAVTLSMTSHTHVISRGCIALGLGLVLFVETPSLWRSGGAGLAFGCAFITRPPETCLLLLPLVLGWAHDAVKDPSQRIRFLGLALGFLPCALIMLAYNHALTGSFGFPRSFPNEISGPTNWYMRGPLDIERWLPRFGNNFSYNLLTLSIWFFGPLGFGLAWLGARTSRLHALLGAGLVLELCLTLLHDDRGLHMVGPIHLSEMAVPLSLLTVAGLPVAVELLERVGVSRSQSWMGLWGYAAIGCTTFIAHHGHALQEQALARVALTEMVEEVEQRPAVVLVGSFSELRSKYTAHGTTGSFVFEWRRARPDLADPVLLLRDSPEARSQVEQAFPKRTPYVFQPDRVGSKLRPLHAPY